MALTLAVRFYWGRCAGTDHRGAGAVDGIREGLAVLRGPMGCDRAGTVAITLEIVKQRVKHTYSGVSSPQKLLPLCHAVWFSLTRSALLRFKIIPATVKPFAF